MKSALENGQLTQEGVKELVGQMMLEEKAGLCSGLDCWNLKAIERLGLASVTMMDGPHGLRKQIGATDNLGVGESVPAVCFPTASALACSFDRSLIYEVGKAIGEECNQEGVSVILGPGANLKRSPLCGRNFEYFSEDPLVSGELAAAMIHGIQSTGTGASLKHFAVNNQEKRRMTINAVVDERALRETYLKAFEIAIKKGKPATVMCSYNRINGEYASENKYLLTDILRKEWGFEGLVVSDWGAVHDRVLGIKAGLDLEMPGNQGYNDKKIVEAVKSGKLPESELNKAACRVTRFILNSMANKKEGFRYNADAHHRLAVKAAEQSAVLLKNDGGLLPGNASQKVAVIGAFAKTPRYQGAGSSKINPIRVESPWDCLIEQGMDAIYAPGYVLRAKPAGYRPGRRELAEQERLIQDACKAAEGKDRVYLFAGLPEGYESEGFDREHLHLPQEQNRLIESVSACNPNTVVILIGGAPMELPWLSKVPSVLLAYLGGEGMGAAVTHLLLGTAVPCGKLAETWPLHLADTPSYGSFPGGRLTTEYLESIYVGYRYYEKAGIPVQFPFGYGLSYVKFSYSNLALDRDTCTFGDDIRLTFTVTNKGTMTAKETAFLFVAHENDTVFLPQKELRGFIKTELAPGESKTVSICLHTAELGYYNTLIHDWHAESGSYQLLVGASLEECPLCANITLISPERPQPNLRKAAPVYYQLPQNSAAFDRRAFESIYGKGLPECDAKAKRPYTWENTPEDIRHTLVGKIMNAYINSLSKKVSQMEEGQEGMMAATIREMPFFAMVASGEEMVSERMMEGIINLLNGHVLKGLHKLLK